MKEHLYSFSVHMNVQYKYMNMGVKGHFRMCNCWWHLYKPKQKYGLQWDCQLVILSFWLFGSEKENWQIFVGPIEPWSWKLSALIIWQGSWQFKKKGDNWHNRLHAAGLFLAMKLSLTIACIHSIRPNCKEILTCIKREIKKKKILYFHWFKSSLHQSPPFSDPVIHSPLNPI